MTLEHRVFVGAWIELAESYQIRDDLYDELTVIFPDLRLAYPGLQWSQKHSIIRQFYTEKLEPWYEKATVTTYTDYMADTDMKAHCYMFSKTNELYIAWFRAAQFADELATPNNYARDWVAYINFLKTIPLAPDEWYERQHRQYAPFGRQPSLLIASDADGGGGGLGKSGGNYLNVLLAGALMFLVYSYGGFK
jgi:phospholipase/lecithinase/hemolysin